MVTEDFIISLGTSLGYYSTFENRRWVSLFGVVPSKVAELISMTKSNPLHMLWALNYLKVYPTIDNGSSWAKVSQKTYVQKIKTVFDSLIKCLPPVSFPLFLPFLLLQMLTKYPSYAFPTALPIGAYWYHLSSCPFLKEILTGNKEEILFSLTRRASASLPNRDTC